MQQSLTRTIPATALIAAAVYAQSITLNFSTTAGADPGLGIPACTEQAGWFSLYDGTKANTEKYWFLPPGQRHGNGGRWWINNGILNSDQNPTDRTGGALFTKRKYKNVETKLDMKPYFGNDGGIFFRSTTYDKSYQVVIDYLAGPTKAIGGIYGESGLHAINYKPFGFTTADRITVGVGHHWNEVQSESPNNWATKIWKVNDYNWIHAKIYHDDPPWIDSWVNEYQMIHYRDNVVENDNLTGHIGIQIHTGSGNWSINNPNLYRKILVREVKPDGTPLASYPEWTQGCGTSVKGRRIDPETATLQWEAPADGSLRFAGLAPGDYTLTFSDLSGKILYRVRGKPGAFSHRWANPSRGIHFLELQGTSFRRALKVIRPGG
jgi:hypothetical protein